MDQRRDARAGAARHGKITLDDVFWSISTERLTGDTAGCGQVVPLHHPRRTALRMMWHAPAGPVTAPLMPVFLGQSSVPPAYRQHRYLTTGESHRFPDRRKETETPDTVSQVPQGIETGPSAFYAFKRLMHLAFQAPRPDPRQGPSPLAGGRGEGECPLARARSFFEQGPYRDEAGVFPRLDLPR